MQPEASSSKPHPLPFHNPQNPGQLEQESVHDVYEAIAPHFSATRHKVGYNRNATACMLLTQQPWPLITTFLSTLPPNSFGLDSGAGNGKYLPTASTFGHETIALDRSANLLGIARAQRDGGGYECVRADLGFEGWRDGIFVSDQWSCAVVVELTPVGLCNQRRSGTPSFDT
jgi:tRNA (uracil-5-)-methyltransferase TRM9